MSEKSLADVLERQKALEVARAREVLKKHPELKSLPGVLNDAIATKWRGDQDTGIVSIVVYVREKKPLKKLKKEEVLPAEVEGIPVDVIEFKSDDFKLDKTTPSELPIEIQRRLAGGVKK